MKRYSAAIILLLTVFITQTAYAQESSPSADLQSKINALKIEIASKAAALKNEINQKLQNRALAGLVQSVTSSQIILASLSGDNRTIVVNTYTAYSADKGLDKTVKKDDFIVALGDLDDKNNLTAKEIIKTKAPATSVNSFWGKIQSIAGANITILTKDNKSLVIKTNKTTTYQVGNVSGVLSNLEDQRTVIVSGFQDKLGGVDARFIYQLSATSSASPSASPK